MVGADRGTYRIVGFTGCGYHQRAVKAAAQAGVATDVVDLPDRNAFQQYLKRADIAPLLGTHRTSPAVFLLPAGAAATDPTAVPMFVGGCDALLARLRAAAVANPVDATPPSRSPAAVLKYFEEAQRNKAFVVWLLWRGTW